MTEPFRPILAAEDEDSDQLILNLAFQKAQLPNPLVLVRDGQEVVDYLSGKALYTDRSVHPLPALLLLDLKMPCMNGFDVLAWLAEQPDFKHIPVVMLSSSGDKFDMNKARQLGAREYFVKPHRLNELIRILHEIHARWLTVSAPDPKT